MPTKTLRPLKPGQECYVRLHTGEIVGARYTGPGYFPMTHLLRLEYGMLVAVNRRPLLPHECRFTTGKPSEENAK